METRSFVIVKSFRMPYIDYFCEKMRLNMFYFFHGQDWCTQRLIVLII